MTLQWQLPEHLGGYTVELETDGLDEDEKVVGWFDDYGTITNNSGAIIGDVVTVKDHDVQAIVMKEAS